ncbi:hypothetical protein PAL_GLEAN10003818 [Pteropus alecto]|uniref:Uncharacterized protein n=1 Tax=Pteropus alecto TaxID=9402 RepID=L5L5U2_PTEAL|nr:hypothetical protein PAL_GLEAN10003818 [Pteropus alecto]
MRGPNPVRLVTYCVKLCLTLSPPVTGFLLPGRCPNQTTQRIWSGKGDRQIRGSGCKRRTGNEELGPAKEAELFSKVSTRTTEFAKIQDCDPEFAKIQDWDPEFAKIQDCDPEFAKIQDCDPEFAKTSGLGS